MRDLLCAFPSLPSLPAAPPPPPLPQVIANAQTQAAPQAAAAAAAVGNGFGGTDITGTNPLAGISPNKTSGKALLGA